MKFTNEVLKLTMSALLVLAAANLWAAPDKSCRKASEAAMKVVERTLGQKPRNVIFEVTGPVAEGEYFSTEAKNGKLTVKGSSTVAVCRGFYDYVTSNGMGLSTWTVNNISLPEKFADSPLKIVTTPFEHRQYMNVCTLGYTMPYWGWEEWEKELDRMALHGVDMPLSPIGSEAIFARVWRKFGLTEEEIGAFVTAPAHLPWFRMGNMSGLDGPLSQNWYDKTIALEHKIIDRMRELGMSPIFNAFAGFVPKGIKRVFPEAELIHTGWDDGPDYVSDFIFPETDVYQTIAKEYIKEWEKEFGKGTYYLADSFNEMKVPFAEKGTQERFDQIASYGKALYNSIASANPDAIWVLQGWMFGYQRHIWDPESIRALFSQVPDEKMLLLDLSVDFNYGIWENEYTWNYAKGIYGKKWIYSTVPNFGGRTCPAGDLDFYLNGHLKALTSENKGKLIGLGTAPEGVENNEVIYEIIADAAWSTSHKDIREWLKQYSLNRYGSCPDKIAEFWEGMLSTAYGMCSSRAQYRVQKMPFFGLGGRYIISEEYFKALESFIAASDELGENGEYLKDLALWAGIYAFGKADVLADKINDAYLCGDREAAEKMEAEFMDLMARADRLLDKNPVTRLERWVDLARQWGDSEAEADHYEVDAKRLVTTWGRGRMPDDLDDYACRMWSGLIRDYYMPRWQHFFDSQKEGKPFDFDAWEYKYAEQSKGVSRLEECKDLVAEARDLVSVASDILPVADRLPGWTSFDMKEGSTRIIRMIAPEDYPDIKALRFSWQRGSDDVKLKLVQINGAGWVRFKKDNLGITIGKDNPVVEIPIDIVRKETYQFIYLHIVLEDTVKNGDSQVRIEYVK